MFVIVVAPTHFRVGYGDICPGTDVTIEGRIFLILLALGSLGFFCGPVLDLASSWHKKLPGGGPLSVVLVVVALGVAIYSYLEG
jgi:Ion channel